MATKAESGPEAVERIGAYRVIRRLATGGTSDVLLAKAEGPHGFERTVVLKVLLSHFGKDDEVAKMFAREASAYARLSHPAIVRLFDFFAVPGPDGKKNGQLVMVLEYVDGPPLARLKSMAKAIGKELDDKASIYIAACIFDALAAAHSAVDDAQIPAPVIHRDVNPSNVLIPWDGYPKLADFGLAKVTGLAHHSVVGMIKGTYGYMAPEQVTGQEAVTPRADVYAAGIILWELLTRRRAFQRGALPEVEALRAMAEPRLPALESIRSDVDRTVRESLRRCLEPRAEKRKITAEEMVSILHAIVPPDQGRERLMSLLGLVRNDARAANAQPSQAPPPMPPPAPGSSAKELLPDVVIPGSPKMAPDFGAPLTLSGVGAPTTNRGVAPPHGQPSGMMAKAPPRPNMSSAKMPAAPPVPSLPSSAKLQAVKPAIPTTTLSSAGMPAAAPAATDANVREMLAMPTRPAMPAVTAPVAPPPPPPPPQRPGSKQAMPAVAAGALPPPEGPPRTKSAAARLAVSLPPEAADDPARPVNTSLLDGLAELGGPQHTMSHPPDSPRVAAPLKDLTGGLGLRDAIDEIMKSSQRGLRAAAPVPLGMETPLPLSGAQMRETTRVPPGATPTLIGMIPPAPPPMTPSAFPAQVVDSSPPPNQHEVITTPPSPKNEWANEHDDPEEEPKETTVVMEPIQAPPAPRMQNASNLGSTMVMEARPPVPHPTPAPMAAVVPPASQPFSPEPSHLISRPPPQYVGAEARPSSPAPSYRPPPKKGIGVGAVAVGLIIVIALGIAGTVAFVRYQAQKESFDAGAYVPPPHPTVSAVATAETTDAATVSPPASTSAAPVAVVAADAAAPVAVVDAAAAAEPIAEGMGQLKTAGAAPGRRIFVDEKVAGQTPETLTLKCGSHRVKLGSTGSTQDIDVPCGGEVTVGDK